MGKKYDADTHNTIIWISIMLIDLMPIINTGHQRRQNVIITANKRISTLLVLDKGGSDRKAFS